LDLDLDLSLSLGLGLGLGLGLDLDLGLRHLFILNKERNTLKEHFKSVPSLLL
jgi:hypothetical protein